MPPFGDSRKSNTVCSACTPHRRGHALLSQVAQFIAVCSSSILAETLGYAVSFSSPWRGKRRVFERCKPVFIDQLQPSTNSDKLSVSCLCPEYPRKRN